MGILLATTAIADDYIIAVLGAVMLGGATAIKYLWTKVNKLSDSIIELQRQLSAYQSKVQMAKRCDVPGCKIASYLSGDSIEERPGK